MTIANCGHDENGRYSGGKAGDQGGEWVTRSWYSRPWDCVLRHTGAGVGEDIALLAAHAAANDKIGYDQNQRLTFWKKLKAAKNNDPANITAACETDCSAGVLAIVKAVGLRKGLAKLSSVNEDGYTGSMREQLKAAGFEVLTNTKYLASDAYLLPGDILLNEAHHTAINLTTGSKVAATSSTATKVSSKTTYTKYKITAKSGLNFRKGPGKKYAITRALPYGKTVKVSSVSNHWAKTNKGDYCYASYIEKA